MNNVRRGDTVVVKVVRRAGALVTNNLATVPGPQLEEAEMTVVDVSAMGQVTVEDLDGKRHVLHSDHILKVVP